MKVHRLSRVSSFPRFSCARPPLFSHLPVSCRSRGSRLVDVFPLRPPFITTTLYGRLRARCALRAVHTPIPSLRLVCLLCLLASTAYSMTSRFYVTRTRVAAWGQQTAFSSTLRCIRPRFFFSLLFLFCLSLSPPCWPIKPRRARYPCLRGSIPAAVGWGPVDGCVGRSSPFFSLHQKEEVFWSARSALVFVWGPLTQL